MLLSVVVLAIRLVYNNTHVKELVHLRRVEAQLHVCVDAPVESLDWLCALVAPELHHVSASGEQWLVVAMVDIVEKSTTDKAGFRLKQRSLALNKCVLLFFDMVKRPQLDVLILARGKEHRVWLVDCARVSERKTVDKLLVPTKHVLRLVSVHIPVDDLAVGTA